MKTGKEIIKLLEKQKQVLKMNDTKLGTYYYSNFVEEILNGVVVVPEEEYNKKEEKWNRIQKLLDNNESYSENLKRKYLWIQTDEGFRVFENKLYAVGKPTKFEDMDEELQEINCICETRSWDIATRICIMLEIEEELRKLVKG